MYYVAYYRAARDHIQIHEVRQSESLQYYCNAIDVLYNNAKILDAAIQNMNINQHANEERSKKHTIGYTI